MEFLDEKSFNTAFGKRLQWLREQVLKNSRTKFAKRLGVTANQLKRYETGDENRDTGAFPLYLLPKLIEITNEPYAFWMGEQPSRYSNLRVVKSP